MIPHVTEAREVEREINSVIPDIKLFFNNRLNKWVVAQIKKNPGGLLLPQAGDMPSATKPYVLFKIEDQKGNYRPPAAMDARRAIEVGKFGNEAIAKGGDWLVDNIEAKEQANKAAADKRLADTVHAIAPTVRRAMRAQS